MTNTEKQQIVDATKEKMAIYKSQNKAAVAIGFSPATLSQMINGNWENITDGKWRTLGEWCGYFESAWMTAETANYETLMWYFDDAQMNSEVYGMVAPPGHSKTYTAKQYAKVTAGCYLLRCSEYWNKKQFVQELLTEMGIDSSGMNLSSMMSRVVREINDNATPQQIIIDEADKLNDNVLYLFISLYNELEDKCGCIMMATDHLEKRIEKGLRLNKKGYQEIFSRLGGRFIRLKINTEADIVKLCEANGITDRKAQLEAVNDSKGDFRRVKRIINKYLKMARIEAAGKDAA